MPKSTLSQIFDFIGVGQQVVAIEREGLAQLGQYINKDFHRACEAILRCAGKVIVMGVGKSGHIGRKLAATFSSTGTPAFFVHPSEASHGDLGVIASQDIVIALSNSGESEEMLAIIPMLKRLRIALICLTSKPNSSMGKAAAIHLCVHVPKEACPFGLTPTASTTAALAMGDALAIALLKARNFTAQDFAMSHPGGELGRKLLLRVDNIMYSGNSIPTVPYTASIQEAIEEITTKSLGITAICNKKNNIAGVFTDGDLRRIFAINKTIDFKQVRISDIMTPIGVRISPDALAIEAANLMLAHNITSLLVSSNNQLVGIVRLHDILRAGLT